MKIPGAIAIITGAASGLGASAAAHLASAGARLALLDIDEPRLHEVAAACSARAYVCDVSDDKAIDVVERIVSELGIPRVLVNCAGIGPVGRIVGREGPHDLDLFKRTLNVNLVGAFNMMRLVAAKMMLGPGQAVDNGVVINTASIAAFEGQIGQAAYAASKGGIVSLTLPAAREFAQFGIRVMSIAPGLFETPLLKGLSDEVKDALSESIPFPRRLGLPDEYARLVIHIIENSYLNVETIRLDGALRMQPK
jgi:NAD(P)-dependent dehydrogenase (short-subunit alcohol dehydrogenase family)